MIDISSFPRLEVEFTHTGEGFTVRPYLSSHFSATFTDPFPATLKNVLIEWLIAYSLKKPFFFPLSLKSFSPFMSKVLSEIQKIPFGNQISYSDLASLAGSPLACRAAGSACRVNPYPLLIPCHRVLSKNGSLGGFSYGPEIKKELLRFEKITYS